MPVPGLGEGKLARAVLRRGGSGNVTSLPGPQGANPEAPRPVCCRENLGAPRGEKMPLAADEGRRDSRSWAGVDRAAASESIRPSPDKRTGRPPGGGQGPSWPSGTATPHGTCGVTGLYSLAIEMRQLIFRLKATMNQAFTGSVSALLSKSRIPSWTGRQGTSPMFLRVLGRESRSSVGLETGLTTKGTRLA